jgi:hypothetical protein
MTMNHNMMPAMPRTMSTARKMYGFVMSIESDRGYERLTLDNPQAWNEVSHLMWGGSESDLTIEDWDAIEGLDNYLHEVYPAWADYEA